MHLSSILKHVIYSSPSLDNFIYKLCYRWTVLFLLAFSIVVSTKLWFGDSFVCAPTDVYPHDYTQAQCYDDTPYILPAKLISQKDGSPIVELTVLKFRKYQTYYPWVNLLFLVQAFSFYLPHLLWKSYEGGYIRRLTAGVQKGFDSEERRSLEFYSLAKNVLATQGKHKLYTCLYIYYEVSNFLIALAQTMVIIHFFGVTGVPDFLPLKLDTWSDFKNFYFPSSGYCEVISHVKSGSTICMMPLNRLFMYMFVFMHSWFVFIVIVIGLVLFYRVSLLAPCFRKQVSLLTVKLAKRSVLEYLCSKMSYSDWFFLTRMQKAMLDIDFAQLLDKIALVSQGTEDQFDDAASFVFGAEMKDFEDSDTTTAMYADSNGTMIQRNIEMGHELTE